jgi:NADPH-dependent glutamate synthase beta subunit-like oxidoreductase
MPYRTPSPREVSLHISRSHTSTAANKTGTWRFLRPRYQEKTAPCSAACPAGEDIGRIQMLAGRRLFSLAGQAALMENPLPAVCGRVCFHPCEAACNRAGLDEPVAVRHVERLVGDYLLERGTHGVMDRCGDAGRRIAVVGAGPAGLSAAYFLNRLGYDCDVFEAAEAPGGLLRWGIPAYRLPGGVLAREIARIEALGVAIRCGVRLRADFLRSARERYDGVFVGCGNARSVSVNFEGETFATDGLDLLRRVRRGQRPAIDGPVAVIGGGNTAIDVARTLVRLGAEPIVCYRRRRRDMPVFDDEIGRALEEGVRIRDLVIPVSLQHDDGREYPRWARAGGAATRGGGDPVFA